MQAAWDGYILVADIICIKIIKLNLVHNVAMILSLCWVSSLIVLFSKFLSLLQYVQAKHSSITTKATGLIFHC